MSAKQAINDKLLGSVATYLRCGGVVNNQIKKGLLLSLRVKKNKSVTFFWQNYKQESDCFVHFLSLSAVFWPGAQSARDNQVLACNFEKYSTYKMAMLLSNKTLSIECFTETFLNCVFMFYCCSVSIVYSSLVVFYIINFVFFFTLRCNMKFGKKRT